MLHYRRFIFLAGLSILATLSTYAQDSGMQPQPEDNNFAGPHQEDKDWQVTLGLGTIYSSRYDGSDDFRFLAIPNLAAEYKGGLFFAGIFDGIGSNFLQGENYKVGASIGFSFGREEKDDRENLRGLGDIDPGAKFDLKGEYEIGPFQISGEVSTGTADYGLTGKLDFGTMFPVSERLMVMGSIGATYADSKHMNTFFGISAEQAERSAYNRFEAKAGIQSVGASLGAFYRISEKLELMMMINADKLLGDAADSPITQEELNPTVFLITSYKF